MNLRFIPPQDHRRTGGSGAAPGPSNDFAHTEPVCFRSEAFAEDLPAGDPGGSSLGLHPHRARPLPRSSRTATPFLGSRLLAALGWRFSAGD